MKRAPLILLVGLALAACDDASETPSDGEIVEIAPITAVQTGSLSGRLTVVAGDGYRVEISTAAGTLLDVKPQVTVDGAGLLRLEDDARADQPVFYRLIVPATTPITLDVEAGAVSIADLRAGVEVNVGAGDILLDQIAGDVTIRLGSGDLRAYDLAAERFAAQVPAGELDASWRRAPADLDVDVSGAAFVALPMHFYDLDLAAGGALDVGALSDVAASDRVVSIRAGGDLALRDLPPQDCADPACVADYAAWRAGQRSR